MDPPPQATQSCPSLSSTQNLTTHSLHAEAPRPTELTRRSSHAAAPSSASHVEGGDGADEAVWEVPARRPVLRLRRGSTAEAKSRPPPATWHRRRSIIPSSACGLAPPLKQNPILRLRPDPTAEAESRPPPEAWPDLVLHLRLGPPPPPSAVQQGESHRAGASGRRKGR